MAEALTFTIDRAPTRDRVGVPVLFVVFIDVTFGLLVPEWMPNSDPQPLWDALAEAAALRRARWIVKVEPEA